MLRNNMGKIRISTLGSQDEKAKKEKAKVRREEKKKRLTHLAGMKGGAKIADMDGAGPEVTSETPLTPGTNESPKSLKLPKKLKSRGKAYKEAQKIIDHEKFYPLTEAIELMKKASFLKFDGTVEVHLNTLEKGLHGQVSLPHGTGKIVRVAIADDNLLEKIGSGKIDFDILVSSPAMMPKLAKFAKVLGPKGLMPNPKNNTISEKPEELVKKLSSGMTQFKTEAEMPIIHFVIGKISFPSKNLEENFLALTKAIGQDKIKSIFLKSTMSPSVKVKI